MVAFTRNLFPFCTGSLVSSRWVISAAHCQLQPGMTVSIGGRSPIDGELNEIELTIAHPSYRRGQDDSPYDIVLVKLLNPAPEGSHFVRINANKDTPKDGAFSRVAGYGETRSTRQFADERGELLQVDIPVVSMIRCKQNFARLDSVARISEEVQLCAGRTSGGCDSCFGDSGGPLSIFDEDGRLVQIGVVSYGIGCARRNAPGVYTRVSYFIDWMRENGVQFNTSRTGVNIFAEGSEAATESSFSFAGLSPTGSILLICGIVACVCSIIIFGLLAVINRSRARARSQRHGNNGENGLTRSIGTDQQAVRSAMLPEPRADNTISSPPPLSTLEPTMIHGNTDGYVPTITPPVGYPGGENFGMTTNSNGQIDNPNSRQYESTTGLAVNRQISPTSQLSNAENGNQSTTGAAGYVLPTLAVDNMEKGETHTRNEDDSKR